MNLERKDLPGGSLYTSSLASIGVEGAACEEVSLLNMPNISDWACGRCVDLSLALQSRRDREFTILTFEIQKFVVASSSRHET